MTISDIFTCKACHQSGHIYLVQGYCPPCLDDIREMVDEGDRRALKPLDGDSFDDARWAEIMRWADEEEGEA